MHGSHGSLTEQLRVERFTSTWYCIALGSGQVLTQLETLSRTCDGTMPLLCRAAAAGSQDVPVAGSVFKTGHRH